MDPVRDPTAVGVNVTEREQLPDAGTLVPQLSVSAKSPFAEIDPIVSVELPMFRRRTCCAGLEDASGWTVYSKLQGFKETAAAEALLIFIRNASELPPSCS